MSELTLSDRIAVPEAVVSRDVGGETVILNLETGIYFGLDPVGSDIWKSLQVSDALQDAFEAIRAEYDVDADVLRRDLLHLVSEMAAKGLVKAAGS